jgi:hypothetical protein
VNIGIEVFVALIGGLFGFLGGVLVFLVQNRRANFEEKHSVVEAIEHEASASEKSAEAVRIYAEQVISLAQQVESLRNEIAKVKADFVFQIEKKNREIIELEKREASTRNELKALSQELQAVREWAERLYCQIQELGAIPVNFENR